MIEGYRRMTPTQKLRRVVDLNLVLMSLARARIRSRRGDIPEKEMDLRLASLWLDRSTMISAFGWDPEREGY